ncbi:MAG: organic hydroperoxide resistance protein [Bacteroidota bacterium]
MIKNILYTAQAKTTGGRNGQVTSDNGALNLQLDMKNSGGATNPEQLFAAGYAACFDSTLHVMADRIGLKLDNSSVNGLVDFGTTPDGGYEIGAKLEVSLPDLKPDQAQKLIALAHENCPYSKATKNNIKVEIITV